MNNKKILLVGGGIILLVFIQVVLANLNIDFRITLPKTSFYPNESIPINFSIINREVTFAARNLSSTLIIGQKTYVFKLDDLVASQSTIKSITLPEQAPGTYTIHGVLNYTGYFGEVTTIDIYNSFEVKFPEIARLPRNIYIKSFDIPENITAGKSYNISVIVANDGAITGDLLVEVESLDVNVSKEIRLEPNQIQTVKLNVLFYNPGISLAEAKVYAIVNNIRYLINYASKNVYVTEEKIAKLEFDKLELIDEADNEINQNDVVKLKIYVKNTGKYVAYDVKGVLSSSFSKISVTKSDVNYILISANESIAPSTFEIKTIDAEEGTSNLNLELSYADSLGEHTLTFVVPIEVKPGVTPPCLKDDDCKTDEACVNSICEKLYCECGEAINHKCRAYACCGNLDCKEGYICDTEKHVCEPSQEIKADVLIVTSSKLKTNDEFKETLRKYRKTISKEGLTSFYILIDSQKVQELFNVQPVASADWKSVKDVLDKIIYKTEPKYVLILGDLTVIPMTSANVDCYSDAKIVLTDDLYGDINGDKIPEIVVARMPSNGNDDKLIVKTLEASTLLHNSGGIVTYDATISGDTCGDPPWCDTIYDTNKLSELVSEKECNANSYCFWSPPYCSDWNCQEKQSFLANLDNSNMIVIESHGSGYSFAAKDNNGNWHTVLTGNDILNIKMKNPFIFIAATPCFGGTIENCGLYKCTSLSALESGAAVYIGNTHYGVFRLSTDVFGDYYKELKESKSIGVAFYDSKQENLRGEYGCVRHAARVTQLYGDPTLKLAGV
jgi:hypothetical protein